MKKRMILTLVGMAVFIGAIAFVKIRQVQAAIAQNSSFQPPPEAVTTVRATQERWPSSVAAIGTVEAVHGVTVAADLPGLVSRIEFDSGKKVRAGDVLVRLDTRQEQAQLAAAEAQRNLSTVNFERMKGLRDKGITSQAEYDKAAAEHKQAVAQTGETQASIGRKTIRAPFSGFLGIRQVNLGQYLKPGDPIVPLQSLDPIYVNFDVPQQQVGDLRVGAEVRVKAQGIEDSEARGTITAVNSVVDEGTRNIQAQATLANPEEKLRPGMFVETQVVLGASTPVVALPTSAISYAPYGNSVFIVGDMKGKDGKPYRGVRQQFVKLGASRGDQVAVVSGVKTGEEVVTSGVFKLRSGAAVVVNNKVQPSNNPAPKPEDS
ncbi:MAG TPA: efflux RND transporter periplasmic adaptor subunit, partial [Thermoanaerobaculia bacterium]|nr:efflux RND transporter periplasmic adaptor subunit [Thermoanaerobaculia bacterium]